MRGLLFGCNFSSLLKTSSPLIRQLLFKANGGKLINCKSNRFLSYPSRNLNLSETKSKLLKSEETTESQEPVFKKVENLRTRFWKNSSIQETDEGFKILLDGRAIKTSSGKVLLIPKDRPTFAHLVAAEWESQDKVVKPHALPLTSLASRATDNLESEQERKETVSLLLKYLDTDSICYHQEFPEKLVNLQKKHFEPLVQWVETKYEVKLNVTNSIIGSRQPKEVSLVLKKAALEFDPLVLAGFERATIASKSFVIALALLHRQLCVEEAAQASHVEVQYQTSYWGECEDTHDVDHQDIRRLLGSSLATIM